MTTQESLSSIKAERCHQLNDASYTQGPVVYWMHRDLRLDSNWAFAFAQEEALQHHVPLHIVFALRQDLSTHSGNLRWVAFMLQGLSELARQADHLHIPFTLMLCAEEPHQAVNTFANELQAGLVVTDFSPLRPAQTWVKTLAKNAKVPVIEVDAHNIVPCWVASTKAEFAARTLRPKIHHWLPSYLEDVPRPKPHPFLPSHTHKMTAAFTGPFDWTKITKPMKFARQDAPVTWLKSGRAAGLNQLDRFISDRLHHYDQQRNDPNADAQSDLSPYLHFGQISAQEIANQVMRHKGSKASQEAFLEELIVRKELADNYCYYTPDYDNFRGLPHWAQTSLNQHRGDKREFAYDLSDFEKANTHELLWNAVQRQLLSTGKIASYLRMYWAKKILEWSESPEEAQRIAIILNDLYHLDGRDPNGYTGVAWSVGGVHDRPWFDRPIYGQVRYMNENGARKKFDVDRYIQRFS